MSDPSSGQSHPGSYEGPPQSPQFPQQGPEYGAYQPAAAQYPAQYPAPYPPPYGYPVPYGYPAPYGYPPAPTGPKRPGLVIAASVLGYVSAGMLILAGAILLFGGAIANDIEDYNDTGTNYGVELAIDGIVNFLAAGLILAGAIMFTGGKPTGRVMFSVGNGIVVAAAVYWFVRFSGDRYSNISDAYIVWGVIFAALAILPLAFSFTGAINNWMREKAATG